MYIKINQQNQLTILRNINPYMQKYKIPREVLHEMGYILGIKRTSKKDYIALFIDPVKNDVADILDSLKLDSAFMEGMNDEFHSIGVKGKKHTMKKKRVWSWYAIDIHKGKYRIFVVYSIKKKHLNEKGGF